MPSSTLSAPGVSALLPLDTKPPLSYRERTRRFLHLSVYQSGLSSLYARLQRESVATILMYHSVPTLDESRWTDPYNSLSAEAFERQMQFLSRYRRVISIEQLVQKLRAKEAIEQRTVAITFDDGYRNNLTVAAPILAKYNLPATIYLATGYIDSEQNQWIDTLYAAFRARSKCELALTAWNDDFQDWNLADARQKVKAYIALTEYLIQATVSQRDALLAEIDRQLAPTAYPPRLTMNWEEARTLKTQYPNITLGAHTTNHLDLRTHSSRAAEEITGSVEQMAIALGSAPKHFAFPYNRYCQHALAEVKAAKISSAVVAANDPVVRANTSPYMLPRLEAPKSMALLKSWTDGGFPDMSRRLFSQPWICPY